MMTIRARLVAAMLTSALTGVGCSASITDDNTDAFCAAVNLAE